MSHGARFITAAVVGVLAGMLALLFVGPPLHMIVTVAASLGARVVLDVWFAA